MKKFESFHPIVSFMYFIVVIAFSMVFMHPTALAISLLCSFICAVLWGGFTAMKKTIIYMIPLILISTIVNPLVNHQGVTVIATMPGGNPLTMEAVFYGILAGAMLSAVICWFSVFNKVMTSDKIVYLFGNFIPTLALVFSMTLRFVPRFVRRLKESVSVQRSMGKDIKSLKLKDKGKLLATVISSNVGWAMESSIQTADSMKARGYGTGRRTSYSIYKFAWWDAIMLTVIILLSSCIVSEVLAGGMYFNCYPSIVYAEFGYGFAAYLLLCLIPIITELAVAIKWKY